jgi:hypothetical protein
VRDADAHEREPAQHDEEAERSAHHADAERRRERALHEGVLQHQLSGPWR